MNEEEKHAYALWWFDYIRGEQDWDELQSQIIDYIQEAYCNYYDMSNS